MFDKNHDAEDFYFEYPQDENPDWDYARNRSFVLKRKQGTWTSSLFSVDFEDFTTPNRDYPQQGLLCRIDGNYVKFLDSLLFKIEDRDGAVDLEPLKVRISPWKVVYSYRSEEVDVQVEYYLAKTNWNGKIGGWVNFKVDSSKRVRLTISPLVDVRELGEESPDPSEYDLSDESGVMKVSKGGREILLGPSDELKEGVRRTDWTYKLDSGDRRIENGYVLFKDDEKNPVKFGNLEYELEGKEEIKIGIVCGKDVKGGDLKKILDKDEDVDVDRANEILETFGLGEDGNLAGRFLKSRLVSLDKFGIEENDLEVPEAGEWWFKDVWFRDLFESLYHDMDFYMKTRGKDWLKKILKWARMFLEKNVMANKTSKGDLTHNSMGATFLYLICLAEFYEKTSDEGFRKTTKKIFDSVLSHFADMEELIRCRANYSWMDSKWEGKPTRIPEKWDVEKGDRFFLPEVNALWIKVLKKFNNICGRDVKVKKLWSKWKETFWNEDKSLPYQIVYKDGTRELKDPTGSSAGIMSMSLLLDHFRGDEVLMAWKNIKEELLVKRKPVFFEKKEMPFGVLVKNSRKRIYLNDEQYHEATVWPRDLPYLFDLLEKIGREDVIRKISINILDHQMSEGAIFYNHELFSLPEGNNPHQMALSKNPVPVKNPVQLWSHFVNEIPEVVSE